MPDWDLYVQENPQSGSWNMAVDDFLFGSVEEGMPHTILRFYRWERPTVSLGYAQRIRDVVDLEFCRNEGIDVVRRITGGKLVLHFNELTYSLCSSDSETFSSTLGESYKRISEAMIAGLDRMGLPAGLAVAPPPEYAKGNLPCFSYPAQNEVEVFGKKIIGSAQKRIGTRFIQHGSVPLEDETALLRSVSFLKNQNEMVRSISLSKALGRKISFTWAVGHFLEGFKEYFKTGMVPRSFSRGDQEAIASLEESRYKNPDWSTGTSRT